MIDPNIKNDVNKKIFANNLQFNKAKYFQKLNIIKNRL